MTAIGIDVKVYHSSSKGEMAARYLALLPALYNDTPRPPRQYPVLCDDDTRFPAPHTLLHTLSTYDATTDLYTGTLSEDSNNIQRQGSQAFGGAGVFFSLPLAAKISSLYSQCSTPSAISSADSGWGPQGDILLRKCIYENTNVRLTLLRSLHQLDIQGDPSGFYESGILPLSLHHFKGGVWHSANPYHGAQITHACGEACFLQRFQTSDDFVISTGYSIAHYPKGIDVDLGMMERTFRSAPEDWGWNLDAMMGPGRGSLSRTGRKVGWELVESWRGGGGGGGGDTEGEGKEKSVTQVYVRRAGDERWVYGDGGSWYRMMERDGVVVLVWIE